MPQKRVSIIRPFVAALLALMVGWSAHATWPMQAQSAEPLRQAPPDHVPLAPQTSYDSLLTYQGRLTNNGGVPVNGPVGVRFRIYDAGGSLVWTSGLRSLSPSNGLFTVYLGDPSDPQLTLASLQQAASIGVTVGTDAEMTPRQALNSIIGHSEDGIGVVGSSNDNYGVFGTSNANPGVVGKSHAAIGVSGESDMEAGVFGMSDSGSGVYGRSQSGNGVFGYASVITAAAVVAYGAGPNGIGLQVTNGGIKVTAAGIGTSTPVFVHVVSAGNIAADSNQTIITHPLTDADPNAILLVTPAYNYGNTAGGVNSAHPVGVFFRPNGGLNKWVIYNIDNAPMIAGQQFNVLVVKP